MIKVKKSGGGGSGKIKIILPLAAALFCGACASFHSGDIMLERNSLKALLEDKTVRPFSKIQVSWQNYPFRNPADSIGEGSISNPPKYEPVPVESGDLEYFSRKAKDILAGAGLYDPKNGSGTLKLGLTSSGRWTYHDLFKFYLVETPFIFILPSSIKSAYAMTAEFRTSSGTLKTEITAYNTTTFHLLLAPLYPLFSPGAKGNSLIRQMLWRTSVEIYEKMKNPEYEKEVRRPARAAGRSEDAHGHGENADEWAGNPVPQPPEPPDRTWLPQKTVESAPAGENSGDFKPIVPQTPDKTWVVPQTQKTVPENKEETAQPAAEIKPAPPERTWIPKSGPEPDAGQSGAEEKPDD